MNTFKAFVYDQKTDAMTWRTFTAQSLSAEVAAAAILSAYGFHSMQSSETLLDRACTTGFVEIEQERIREGWDGWWKRHGESTAINGPAFVAPELPSEAEIIEAIRARLKAPRHLAAA